MNRLPRLSRVDYALAALALLFVVVTACALTQGPPTGTPRGTAGSPPRGLPPPAAPPAVGRLRAVAPGTPGPTPPAGSLAAVATTDPNNGNLGRTFAESFDGAPAAPAPFSGVTPNGVWDVTVHSRDVNTWTRLEPMVMSHGPDCAGPPATHATNGAYENAVFSCRDHLMTGLYAEGYGLIYLTPNQRVDFSGGTATITFDVSTLRTSERDWIDLWVTPFQENMQLALDRWLPDLSGEPKDAVHIKMNTYDAPDGSQQTVFGAEVVRNGVVETVPGNWWQGYERFLTTSASRRDTFQLRLSQGHIAFGMPAGQAAVNGGQAFWWTDADIAPLGWTSGVVQLGQHSYNPSKNSPVDANGVPIYGPDTWHWDNVVISPAIPFFMSLGTPRLVSHNWPQPPGPQGPIVFAQAAPDNAYLRFTATGDNVRISLDGGATWQPAIEQPGPVPRGGDTARSFWMPVPRGTSVVFVQADGGWWADAWDASDFSLWALSSPDVVPTPLPSATFVPTPNLPTPTPAATATITATFPPTATPGPTQPTSTPTLVPTVTRTPTPAATMTSTATVTVTVTVTVTPTIAPTVTATAADTATLTVTPRPANTATSTPTVPVSTSTPAPPTSVPAYEQTQSARIGALETCVAGLTNARLRC